jgi:iron(III)-enterobactin esterase
MDDVATGFSEGIAVGPDPRAPAAAATLGAADLGTAAWWQRVAARGAPLVERYGPHEVCVTFLWRDPKGSAATSPICRVYADVNSVTDHHSPAPQSLVRLGETDVWCWQVVLPSDWRGSYVLIPVTAAGRAPAFSGSEAEKKQQQRQWWRSIQRHAVADPLNQCIARNDRTVSALHLPDAPDQRAWIAFDRGDAFAPDVPQPFALSWRSARLGTVRTVWLYATGADALPAAMLRPLVLLLDGQRWHEDLPIYGALAAETDCGRLPPAVYALIDAIDGAHRERELGCDRVFWQALQTELLPLIAAQMPHSALAADTVVAGQSLGGLAAVFAALQFPARFGAAASQSGSFWWPRVELLHAPFGQSCARRPGARGELAERVAQSPRAAAPLRVRLDVGRREDVMIDLTETLRAALVDAGHDVVSRDYEGGHDALCWRGALIDALRELLDPAAPRAIHSATHSDIHGDSA